MKKLLALAAVVLFIYFLYGSVNRIAPSYFIKIADIEYSFEDFFKNSLSHDTYGNLEKQQKFAAIYEQLKMYLCQPDCNITVYSFAKVPIDPEVEGLFYRRRDALTEEKIQQGRIALAREQYFFSILDRTVVIINDNNLKLKIEGSVLPWIGKTQDGLLIEFMYATNFNEWFRPWMLRFIRDYRSFVKIHMLPYEEGVDFMEQVKTAVCLKEKQVFWELFFSDMLDLKKEICVYSSELVSLEKHDLAIRLGDFLYTKPESYSELAKNFQISYLALKVR